jgi:hypothetical protein
MKTSWETSDRASRRESYVYITELDVVVGDHHGSGHTDNASSCSHREFLAGRFHDSILAAHGPLVLREVVESVLNAGQHEPFRRALEQIAFLRRFLDDIPFEEQLGGVPRDPRTEDGSDYYGNQGSGASLVRSENRVLRSDRSDGVVLRDTAGRLIKRVPLGDSLSAIVALDDFFYVVAGQRCVIIDPCGEMLSLGPDGPYFGHRLRASDVYRAGDVVCFQYRWFSQEYPSGLLRAVPGAGFVGRFELERGDFF